MDGGAGGMSPGVSKFNAPWRLAAGAALAIVAVACLVNALAFMIGGIASLFEGSESRFGDQVVAWQPTPESVTLSLAGLVVAIALLVFAAVSGWAAAGLLRQRDPRVDWLLKGAGVLLAGMGLHWFVVGLLAQNRMDGSGAILGGLCFAAGGAFAFLAGTWSRSMPRRAALAGWPVPLLLLCGGLAIGFLYFSDGMPRNLAWGPAPLVHNGITEPLALALVAAGLLGATHPSGRFGGSTVPLVAGGAIVACFGFVANGVGVLASLSIAQERVVMIDGAPAVVWPWWMQFQQEGARLAAIVAGLGGALGLLAAVLRLRLWAMSGRVANVGILLAWMVPAYVFLSSWFGLTRGTLASDLGWSWNFFLEVWKEGWPGADLMFALGTALIGAAGLGFALLVHRFVHPRAVLGALVVVAGLALVANWAVYALSFSALPDDLTSPAVGGSRFNPQPVPLDTAFSFTWEWGWFGLLLSAVAPLAVGAALGLHPVSPQQTAGPIVPAARPALDSSPARDAPPRNTRTGRRKPARPAKKGAPSRPSKAPP